MKNKKQIVVEAVIHGVVFTAIFISTLIAWFTYEEKQSTNFTTVTLEVDSIEWLHSQERQDGSTLITINFIVNNPDKKLIRHITYDCEFLDDENKFIYGEEDVGQSNMVSPKERDNVSINISIPSTVNLSEIHETRISAHYMDF